MKPLRSLKRAVANPRNSILDSGTWEELDWDNWWMDSWQTDAWRYLHVENKDKEDGRVHRVYSREKAGRRVTMGVFNGVLTWIYGATEAETEAWLSQEDDGR